MEKAKEIEPSSERPKWFVNTVSAAVPLSVAAGAGFIANRAGVSPTEILDSQFLVKPPVVENSVDGMVWANEALRSSAPVIAAGLIGAQVRNSVAGLMDSRERNMNRLARLDYSGQDDGSESSGGVLSWNRLRRYAARMSLAGAAATLIGSTSGLANEIAEGPLRPIDAVTRKVVDQVPNANDKPLFVLQSPDNTLMDDSVIPKRDLDNLYIQGRRVGVTVVPFSKSLFNVDDKSAMQFALPDQVFEDLTGEDVDKSCENVPVTVDKTVKAKAGGEIDINGTKAQVIKVEEDENLAQMNRSIVIMSDTDLRSCVMKGADASYFGAIIPDAEKDEVVDLIKKLDSSSMTVVSQEEFRANNREFWQRNSTPLVLILTICIAGLGSIAIAKQRLSYLEHNKNEIGSLMAAGVSSKMIEKIEIRRTLKDSLAAGVVSAPFMPLVTAAFNATSSGLNSSVGPREWLTGLTVGTVSSLIATKSATTSFKRRLDLGRAVKG